MPAMDLEGLRTPCAPWLLEFVGSPARAYELAWKLATEGMVTRVLHGAKMTRHSSFYDEVAAALQFPDYFGENPQALDECISDLSWLPADSYLLVIADGCRLLEEEQPRQFELWLAAFQRAAERWAKPIERGEWWDRPARAFHIVFQAEGTGSELLRSRCNAAGVHLEPLDTT